MQPVSAREIGCTITHFPADVMRWAQLDESFLIWFAVWDMALDLEDYRERHAFLRRTL